MELNLYSSEGRKLNKKVKLDQSVFISRVDKSLMSMAVRVYLMNKRQNVAHVKTRGEVRGGGRKPWAQKGTGRARHGSIRSPIWKGGGVVFGPRKNRSFTKKLPKKMKKAAIRSALSYFAKEKKIIVLQDIEIRKHHLTKQLIDLTKSLPVEGKVLYIQDGSKNQLFLASRNLKDINAIGIGELNIYKLLYHDCLVILQDTLNIFSKFWGSKKVEKVKGIELKDRRRKIKTEVKKDKKVSKPKEEAVRRGVGKDLGSLKLGIRIENALKKQGINTKNKLERIIKSGKKIEGVGEKSLEKIRRKLKVKS